MKSFLFGFNGRFNRQEFWICILISMFFISALPMIFGAIIIQLGGETHSLATSDLSTLQERINAGKTKRDAVIPFLLLSLIPGIWIFTVASIKRLHDRGKSGIWFLIILVPYVGGLWHTIECGFFGGEKGNNQYDISNK